ncbi:MAG: diadenylate cyclase [Anaerolineales bacterium]|jgi:diadenylate cyclase
MKNNTLSEMLARIGSAVGMDDDETLERVLTLAIELVLQGREGRKIGTMFVLGDSDEVLRRSRNIILDPLYGHPDSVKQIRDAGMRETLKELSQLDGAFIISEDGVVLSGSRLIDVDSGDVEIPMGLGSRHYAAAAISKKTRAVAIVVSKSSVIRIFQQGKLAAEIMPQKMFLSECTVHLEGPYAEHSGHELTTLVHVKPYRGNELTVEK